MTLNVVCHVRITPIRGLNLQAAQGEGKEDAKNPFILCQIDPWKVRRKCKPLPGGGSNPIWPSGSRTRVDLPYYGHPLPGEKPSLKVIALDSRTVEIDEEEDSKKYSRIGQAEIDLASYLNQKIDGKYNLELNLKDKQGNPTGAVLMCSLQFVLTGKVRLTVVAGQNLRSVERRPDQEPYVEAYLQTSRAHKVKTTNTKYGENPKWGEYTRQATLLSFASARLFSSANLNQVRKGPNVLEFKYYDDDGAQVPLIMCQVKDKMDTKLKRGKQERVEKERLQKIKDEIRALKAQEATKRRVPLVPRRRRRLRQQGSLFTLFRPREEIDEKVPLSKEEEAMAEKYAALMKEKEEAEGKTEVVASNEDRLIGKGAIDIRQVLTYDGMRQPLNLTVELTDENELAAGALKCTLEFENFAYDKARKDVIRLPEFDDFSFKGMFSMNGRRIGMEIRKLYIYGELQLDMYGPSFIIRTSNRTGMSKILLAIFTSLFVAAAVLSVWFGLGSRTISYLVGVLYPVYQSYKALESRSKEDATQWLTYWIVYGCFNFFENTVARPIVYVYPLAFYAAKMAFLVWLIEPGSLGATFIYYFVLQPLISRHETDIDTAMETFGEAAREAARDLSGIRGQLQEEFQAITAVQEVSGDAEGADESADGVRVFVATLEDPENAKMMVLSKSKPWDNILSALAYRFSMSEKVELVMIVNENVTVKIDDENRSGVRENDRLYLKQASDVTKLRYIDKKSSFFTNDEELF